MFDRGVLLMQYCIKYNKFLELGLPEFHERCGNRQREAGQSMQVPGKALRAPTRRVSKTTGRGLPQRTAEGRVMTESNIAKILNGIPSCPCMHRLASIGTPRICVNSFSEQVNSGKQDAKAEAIYTKEAGAAGYDRQGHASRHSVPQGISRSRRRVASRPRG